MALATSWIESSKYRVSSLGSQELIAVASPDFSKTHFSQKREHQAFLEAPSLSHISNKTLNARFLAQVFGHSGEVSSNGLPTHHGIQNACREHKGWALLPSQLLTKDLSEGRLINLMQGHGLDVEVYFYVLISFDQIMPQVAVEIELLSRQFLQTFSPAQRTISPENQINR